MSYKIETDKEIYTLDSETKPTKLTVKCDKDASSHIAQQPLLDRFHRNTIYLLMLCRECAIDRIPAK